MNILFFIYSMHSGGAERVTSSLANYWAGKGWQVTIVTLASKDLDFYNLHPAVRRIALNLTGESPNLLIAALNNFKRLIVLQKVLRKNRPDITLGMMSTANILLCLAAFGLRDMKVIVSERVYPPIVPIGHLWKWLRSFTYPLSDRVIMQTYKGLEWLLREVPKARGAVIPNPVSSSLAVSEPVLVPEKWVKPNCKLLLAAGRFGQQKRFDQLLQVFAELAPTNLDWDLVILGEGRLRSELERLVQTLGLTGRVHIPGRAGNIGDWYERADLYVMSSHFEGFPNTLGEAMAYGCAAVSFDCDTGPRDIIRHEVDGLLVPPGDAVGLTAALKRLMNDESLRKQMAGRAFEVRERFSLEKVGRMWEELFIEVRR